MTSNHSSQSHLNHERFHFPGVLLSERNPILILNDALDHLNVPYDVNEQTIENFLQNLKAFDTTPQPAYWLIMARLFELSLILAGHYADNCEFSAAGDLLVNPRKVLVHRKGYPYPLKKPRHGSLTDQLNKKETCRQIVLFQVKHEVMVEVAQPAILPYLFGLMESSCQQHRGIFTKLKSA
jgi:hypothetical protein